MCDDGAETDTATDDHRVSLIITDPPWGYFEDIGDIGDFYGRFFDSVKNIICSGGRMVLLTARVEELKKITAEKSLNVLEGPHTLVNGKKAGVFIITF